MKYYVADAFAEELFRGNPAGVCLPEKELSADLMQKIAFENNLAETAFTWESRGIRHLRWFTPEVEIDLCGHATLATAYILMTEESFGKNQIDFSTKSGILSVRREGGLFAMNFPARPPVPTPSLMYLEEALGCEVLETQLSRDLVVLTDSHKTVASLKPDMDLLKKISKDVSFAVIVTAKGDDCDFVSRFFAPNAGIDEDPVTGSSHCTLIPYWSKRLGKSRMIAKQLSPRGGTLDCQDLGDRVQIAGKAVCYLQGEINVIM